MGPASYKIGTPFCKIHWTEFDYLLYISKNQVVLCSNYQFLKIRSCGALLVFGPKTNERPPYVRLCRNVAIYMEWFCNYLIVYN